MKRFFNALKLPFKPIFLLLRWFLRLPRRLYYAHIKNISEAMQYNLSISTLHQHTFARFKNLHQGQDIVVLATGPTAARYQPLDGAIHIGLNRAFDIAPVALDYAFLIDHGGSTHEFIDGLNRYNPDSCTKFYGIIDLKRPSAHYVPEGVAIKANALRFYSDTTAGGVGSKRMKYDILNNILSDFGSVVFSALQFALWTNPRRIYLVGCDCTRSGYTYDFDFKNRLEVSNVIKGYREFKRFAARYYPDTEIVSINPVGLKGLFSNEIEY